MREGAGCRSQLSVVPPFWPFGILIPVRALNVAEFRTSTPPVPQPPEAPASARLIG